MLDDRTSNEHSSLVISFTVVKVTLFYASATKTSDAHLIPLTKTWLKLRRIITVLYRHFRLKLFLHIDWLRWLCCVWDGSARLTSVYKDGSCFGNIQNDHYRSSRQLEIPFLESSIFLPASCVALMQLAF
jgi:hypothetical protein